MHFALDTAILCALGWALHWFGSWGEAYKKHKLSLADFILESPPAFGFSVTATLALYLMGPAALPSFGIVLPDSPGLLMVGAFLIGYAADSAVYKIATLVRRDP